MGCNSSKETGTSSQSKPAAKQTKPDNAKPAPAQEKPAEKKAESTNVEKTDPEKPPAESEKTSTEPEKKDEEPPMDLAVEGKKIFPDHEGAPTLYVAWGSAPCRACLMAVRVAGMKVNVVPLDLMKHEHKTEDYKKINPDQTVPGLKDGDFSMGESKAILTYLMNKYAPESSLYPSDLQKRAHVNRHLYYDSGSFYKAIGEYVYPLLFGKVTTPSEEAVANLTKTLDFVEAHMGEYMCGDEMTIADTCMLASFSMLLLVHFDHSKWPKITAWFERVKAQQWFTDANKMGFMEWKGFMDAMKSKSE